MLFLLQADLLDYADVTTAFIVSFKLNLMICVGDSVSQLLVLKNFAGEVKLDKKQLKELKVLCVYQLFLIVELAVFDQMKQVQTFEILSLFGFDFAGLVYMKVIVPRQSCRVDRLQQL